MGTVLLLAAAPASEARVLDAASALPGLAAVPAGVFTGTESASVVELADPVDPQAVLVRFRAAAAAEGPLTVVIVAELHADARRGGIHIALARTNPSTIRYSALPWAWLTHELAARAPSTTTLLVDLAAGPAAWELLGREGLPMGEGVAMYGRVFPAGPPPRWRRKSGRPPAAPAYIQEFVRVWRSGARPPLPALHDQAAAQAGPADAVFLAADTGGPGTAGFDASDPGTAGFGASAGAGGPLTAPQPVDAPPAPAQPPAPGPGFAPAAEPAPAPGAEPGPAPVPQRAQESAPDPMPTPPPLPPAPADARRESDAPHGPGPAGVTAADDAPQAPPRTGDQGGPQRSPYTGYRNSPQESPYNGRHRGPQGGPPADPHEAIFSAARAGRHGEAASIAAAWEGAALRAEGAASDGALHWLEVRADLARLAEDPTRSCELWMAAARVRVERGEAADAQDVEAAVDRAHHQWEQLRDPATARRLAPTLLSLRRQVPGRQPGAVRLLEERLEALPGAVSS